MTVVARSVAPLGYVLSAVPGDIEKHGMPLEFDALAAHRSLTFGDSGPAATWNCGHDGVLLQSRPAAGLPQTFVVGEDIRAGRAVHMLARLETGRHVRRAGGGGLPVGPLPAVEGAYSSASFSRRWASGRHGTPSCTMPVGRRLSMKAATDSCG